MAVYPSLVICTECRSVADGAPQWPILSASLYYRAIVRGVLWRRIRLFVLERSAAILQRWLDRIAKTLPTLRSSLRRCLGILGLLVADRLLTIFPLGALPMIGNHLSLLPMPKWIYSKRGLATCLMSCLGRNDDLTRRPCQ